jgi:hypothetical protein
VGEGAFKVHASDEGMERRCLQNPQSLDTLPEWNECTGFKVTRLKNGVFDHFKWDDKSRAASDMAFLLGESKFYFVPFLLSSLHTDHYAYRVNANSGLATFWFFFATLQSKHLSARATEEVPASSNSVQSLAQI